METVEEAPVDTEQEVPVEMEEEAPVDSKVEAPVETEEEAPVKIEEPPSKRQKVETLTASTASATMAIAVVKTEVSKVGRKQVEVITIDDDEDEDVSNDDISSSSSLNSKPLSTVAATVCVNTNITVAAATSIVDERPPISQKTVQFAEVATVVEAVAASSASGDQVRATKSVRFHGLDTTDSTTGVASDMVEVSSVENTGSAPIAPYIDDEETETESE